MHQDFLYAIQQIHDMNVWGLANGSEMIVCQITHLNKGFNQQVIEDVREALKHMHFDLPTHISLLPEGKKPTSQKLFDGLEEVFCNSNNLREKLKRMQQERVKRTAA